MARIRTIKPEFWDSPDTAKASAVARLLYIAMWNWADDAGRGVANIKELEGFAFPNDDVRELSGGSSENFRSVLAEVRGSFGVRFYKVRNRPYYDIPSWSAHQRNERVAKGRHPTFDEGEEWDFMATDQESGGTSDDFRRTMSEAPTSRAEVPKSSGPGTGEQGNRGTGNTSRPGKPAEEFALEQPLTDSTYEVGSDDDPKWLEFWAAVPKKDGKVAARVAWTNHVLGRGKSKGRRIEKTDPDVITAGMLAYSERVRREGTERRHIKMAEGWINDRRWEDEVQPRVVSTSRVHGDTEGIWT